MANATTAQPVGNNFFGLNGGQMGVDSNATMDTMGQLVTVTLTAAQIDSMFTTPIVLIPATAAGTGRTIFIDYVVARYASGGTAFTGGGAISLQYAGGAVVAPTLPAATINTTTSSDTALGNLSANLTCLQNTAITVTNATAAFATGNGTLTLIIHYSVN